MSDRRPPQPVPDYTNAFLGMVYLILVMGLMVIWGLWGYLVALATSAALNAGLGRLGRGRGT